MKQYLYRGVSEEMHNKNIGLLPKGNSFSSFVEMGSSIAEMGNGITHGCSEENAVIGHQKDSNEYKTSGISTTPHIDRAELYATRQGTQNGIVYKIDISRFTELQIKMFEVGNIVIGSNVPEDDEIILTHVDNGELPSEIVVDTFKISKHDFIMKNSLKETDKNIKKLKKRLVQKISHFQYSEIAKVPFKVHELTEVLNYKTYEVSVTLRKLLRNGDIIPSLFLLRSLFENLAMIYRLRKYMMDVIDKKTDKIDDDIIMQLSFGSRHESEIQSINILTLIQKIDKEYNGIEKFYSMLCEFVHPNWYGLLGSYCEIDEENNITYYQKTKHKHQNLFKFSLSSFKMTLSIFLTEYDIIKENLSNFALICENEIEKKQPLTPSKINGFK